MAQSVQVTKAEDTSDTYLGGDIGSDTWRDDHPDGIEDRVINRAHTQKLGNSLEATLTDLDIEIPKTQQIRISKCDCSRNPRSPGHRTHRRGIRA